MSAFAYDPCVALAWQSPPPPMRPQPPPQQSYPPVQIGLLPPSAVPTDIGQRRHKKGNLMRCRTQLEKTAQSPASVMVGGVAVGCGPSPGAQYVAIGGCWPTVAQDAGRGLVVGGCWPTVAQDAGRGLVVGVRNTCSRPRLYSRHPGLQI